MKRIIHFLGERLLRLPLPKTICCFLFCSVVLVTHANNNTDGNPLVTITTQPVASRTVCQGSNTTFSVVASGSGALTYQWQVSTDGGTSWAAASGANYSGEATATLSILSAPGSFNAHQYRCIVSDGTPLTSSVGTLTVNPAPIVQSGHVTLNMCGGSGGTQVTAPLYSGHTYQWYVSSDNGASFNIVTDGASYTGSATNIMNINYTSAFDGNIYRYISTNTTTGCTAVSDNDTLHVVTLNVTSTPPSNTLACAGGTLTLPVVATGNGPLSYQWALTTGPISDGSTYTGTTTSSLGINLPNTAAVLRYQVTIANRGLCNIALGPFQVQVRARTAITAQPQPVTVCALAGTTTNITTTASGSGLTYQWETDNGTGGVTWSNAGTNSNAIDVGNVPLSFNGYQYRVTANGNCGPAVTSSPVTLTVRSSGTWLGVVDTNWHIAGNWCGGVPTSTTDVLIPNGAPRMPTISNTTGTAFSRSLNIENLAKLTINGGSASMSGPFNIQGTVAYTALVDQPILPADHGSLEVGGSGNKNMQSNIRIAHNLVLADGAKLVTHTNILTMNAGSNPVVCSPFSSTATSWIVTGNGAAGAANTGLGGFRYDQVNAGLGALIYPVGPTSTSYNPIRLTNTGTTDNFTIAVNDQQIPGGLYAAGIDRTWQISETAAGGSSVALEVKWGQVEEQYYFNRALSEIIRSDGTSIVQNTSTAASSGTNPFVRGDGSFSVLTLFSVASHVALLPVKWQSFTARAVSNTTEISWKVDARHTVTDYIVQRSADGVKFTDIGSLAGITNKTTYTYIDNNPGNGLVYYRLKISAGERTLYSNIAQVLFGASRYVAALRPSVTNQPSANLFIMVPQRTRITVSLADVTGRRLSHQAMLFEKGDHTWPLPVERLGKGIYFVQVQDDQGNSNVLTLIKQ